MTTDLQARLRYLVGNPSAWKSYDEGVSELMCEALAHIQELEGALGEAEVRIRKLYDGIAPQAHYEGLGIEGDRSGNRHADNDEVVRRIRSALGRNAGCVEDRL